MYFHAGADPMMAGVVYAVVYRHALVVLLPVQWVVGQIVSQTQAQRQMAPLCVEEAEGGRGYKAYSLKNEDGNFVTVAQVYSEEDDENSDVRMCFQDGHIFERFY